MASHCNLLNHADGSRCGLVLPKYCVFLPPVVQPEADHSQGQDEQLNQYDKQGMFDHPCIPPPDAAIFLWVWIYKIKEENNDCKKAHTICDGSTHGGHAQMSDQIFTPNPDMTDLSLFFTHAALENKLCQCSSLSLYPTVSYVENTTLVPLFPLHL